MRNWTDPDAWWDAIEPNLHDPRLWLALIALAIAGALGVALACEIGVRHFNTDWNYALGYTVQRGRSWQPFIGLWLGLSMASVLQGLVAAALLPVYSKPRQWIRAMAVSIVGWLPMYVAGLSLMLLPAILLFAIAFLISCAWWANGNRRLLGLGFSEAPEHIAVTLVISGALMLMMSGSVAL